MRLALVVMGSRGDVQPFLALGSALARRGHEVRLATHGDFAALAREAGLAFRPLPGSPAQLFSSPEMVEALRRGPSVLRFVRAMGRGDEERATQSAAAVAALRRYVDLAIDGVDAVVASVSVRDLFLAAPPPVPYALASWYPHTPTAAFPAMGAPRLPLGGAYNRLTHRVSQRLEWTLSRRVVDADRRGRGLPPMGRRAPFAAQERGRPFFYVHSPAVIPRPADWPANYHLAGHWFWDRAWEPPRSLSELLAGGEPPVVLTFGSLWPACPPDSLELVAAAVRAHGRRLVTVDGPTDGLPPGVLRLHDVDYTWLFPRAAAVVHHGGFGTGAAVLRAGVPQIVTPIFIDHPFWARRMHGLGVAPRPRPADRLTAAWLSRSVGQVLGDARMRDRAAGIGHAVRADRGVDHACDALEAWATSWEPLPAPR